jgi:arsenite-transporting ATPase
MDQEFDSTIKNLVDQLSLKWVFVGGKGGVGKTTTSSSIAVIMSQYRKKVVEIDPGFDHFDRPCS